MRRNRLLPNPIELPDLRMQLNGYGTAGPLEVLEADPGDQVALLQPLGIAGNAGGGEPIAATSVIRAYPDCGGKIALSPPFACLTGHFGRRTR